LKTITKGEFTFFTDILREYYEHVLKNPDTLIVRTYGLYKLKIYVNKQKINTIYFLSMENIFSTVKKEDGLVID
jgi:1-phosphatidylinositol-4-phosphate 5-kinase